MSGRNLYLVAYDIRNPKRLRNIHKALLGFGDPLQFSVFQCALTAAERQGMITAVTEIIHQKEDRVLIVDMGPQEGRGPGTMQVLGLQEVPRKGGPIVL